MIVRGTFTGFKNVKIRNGWNVTLPSFWYSHREKGCLLSPIHLQNGKSGTEISQNMIDDSGIVGANIILVPEQLTVHYYPGNRTINLSEVVYPERNAAAAAAAHEVGYPMQQVRILVS